MRDATLPFRSVDTRRARELADMPLPQFNKHFDLKLLKLVKENPILYNNGHSNYLNFDAREVVWQKIGDELSRPAVEFAGIQCQIHFDDYQEEKHKSGYIENLSEYLPEQYSRSWGIEKKILKAYKKHIGINQLEAKSLYIKTARDLPTYGVTFFLVKEKQKGKNKLVPRLLGINSESILRLDEVTKEVLQVWPLTHVKTYQAGKAETFTLNFGDYSEKEYSVKTRDAHRIRDILEGYIDIIRKRLLAKSSDTGSEGIIIYQDNVEACKGNMIQMVSNNPQKLVSECFIEAQHVGSKDPERALQGGAQIVTAHQIIVAGQVNQQQQAVKGEIAMRSDMPMDCVRRLNRLNTMSVGIVTQLTDPNEQNIREVQRSVDTINREIMPILNDGISKTAEKQATEEAKQKLLNDLQDLSDYVKTLSDATATGNVKPREAESAAKNIADLTTQMYFSMDPRTKRRSDLLNRSRKSFIEDERIDSSLRRASFIAAASTALHLLDDADRDVFQAYHGPALSKAEIQETERAAADKIGQLNAAIALYLTAHTDPKAIDYSAAVTSMNTIKELVPELVKDTQAIGSVLDSNSRQHLLGEVKDLCDCMKKVCTVTGSEDHEKMQDASSKYGDASRRLVFTLGRGANPEEEHQITNLAKVVSDHTSALVITANEFRGDADESTSEDIKQAEAHALNCAKDLLACAQVTSGRSGQAVCVGALATAAESVAGAAQRVVTSCRPLLHLPSQHDRAQELRARATKLAEALDALNNACSHLPDDGTDQVSSAAPTEVRRLKFITSTAGAKKRLQAASDELNKPEICALMKEEDGLKMQDTLSQKLALLNAAIASLLTATSDRENPDYETAELAVNTISDLLPDLIKDAKTISSTMEPAERKAFLDRLCALSDASQEICENAGVDNQGLNDSIANYTNASRKIIFKFEPTRKTNGNKEQRILDLSAGACGATSQLLATVQQLAMQSEAETRHDLDAQGGKVADAAQALLTAAQVTGPSVSEPRCQSAFLTSVDGLALSSQQLSNIWRRMPDNPQQQALEAEQQQLESVLKQLRDACHDMPLEEKEGIKNSPIKESQRLKFTNTVTGAKKRFDAAEDELNKPNICGLMREEDGVRLKEQLSQKLGQLNAAIAALLRATSDRSNPDYTTAEEAVTTISTLLPYFVKDAKTLSGTKDPVECQSVMDQLQVLCDSSKAICSGAGTNNEGADDSIAKFANASEKLVFVFKPAGKNDCSKEQEIIKLSADACGKASQLLANVQQVATQLDGEVGLELDCRGAKVADAAKNLLTTAQITAPSISEPQCHTTLLSSVDAVSSSSHHLADGWRQLPNHHQHKSLETEQTQLDEMLNLVKEACHSVSKDERDLGRVQQPTIQESQRLKFINTVSGVKNRLDAVDQELNKSKICTTMTKEDGGKLQEQLSKKLAQLNAAIASLITATSDREKPDYVTAEKAVNDISDLLPAFVRDAKVLSTTKEPAEYEEFLDQIRAISEAGKAICGNLEGNNEGLNDSVARYANASGKLVYVFKPVKKVDVDKEQKILDLSGAACGKVSQLLANVQQVAVQLDGDLGQELDSSGARVADAAQALLATAQITAPSISEPRCQSSLLSSVDAVSASSHHLADGWRQLPNNSQRTALELEQKQLDNMLNEIRKVCHDISADDTELAGAQTPLMQDNHRLTYDVAVSDAKKRLDAIDNELNKPDLCALMKEEDGAKLQEKLSQKLALLNAAIASLLAATADRTNPDYVAAEKAVTDLSNLLPAVVKDAKVLSATKEPADCKMLLDQIRAIADAGKAICANAGGNNEGLNDSVARYANASGKLVYVFTPAKKVDTDKEQEILDLSGAACGKASELLTNVQQVSVNLDGDIGQELDSRGARVADAAQTLLTTAQITAPTILEPRCKSGLLSAVDAVSSSSHQLADEFRKLPSNHQRQLLETEQGQLEDLLDGIRQACLSAPKRKLATLVTEAPSPEETERLKFINITSQAQKWLHSVDDELNKPAPTKPINGEDAVNLKDQLSQKLAQLNAAIASLLTATSDRSHPDYATAEQAVGLLTLLLPDVVKDAKILSSNMVPAERKVMFEHIRSLHDASNEICASAGNDNKGLNEAAEKYGTASGNLMYTYRTPQKADVDKEQQITDLSVDACGAVSPLLASVQQLAEKSDADVRRQLDNEGTKVADAAQTLLTSTRVTAPSITDPHCQSALLSSVDGLWSASQQLSNSWAQLPDNQQRRQLETELRRLEDMLKKMRKACQDIPKAGSSVVKTKPPVTTKPIAHPVLSKTSDSEENQAHTKEPSSPTVKSETSTVRVRPAPPAPPKRVDDEQNRLQQKYMETIDGAKLHFKDIVRDLNTLCTTRDITALGTALSANEAIIKQDRIEDNLALAGVTVASLIRANYAEKMDYPRASMSMTTLPQLVALIVEDGKSFSTSLNDDERRLFLNDMVRMCDASVKLCDATYQDKEKLKDAAIVFGDESAKLFYFISTDADVSLNKEIVHRAKVIGASASQLAMRASEVSAGASAAGEAKEGNHKAAWESVWGSGIETVNAVTNLLYTAKLVAPSIHKQCSQNALTASTDELSNCLKKLSNSWRTECSDPHQAKLLAQIGTETDSLDKLVQELKEVVVGAHLGQQHEMDKMVVEDTPLRNMTCKIIDDAKKTSQLMDLPASLRSKYTSYANQLSDALAELDLSAHRSKCAPRDTNKRRDLENAIQNLQTVLLQYKPNREEGREMSNVVDLRDFIQDVSTEADKLLDRANQLRVMEGQSKIEEIKEHCYRINERACRLMNPEQHEVVETSLDGLLLTDSFAQDCESRAELIKLTNEKLEDEKAKGELQPRVHQLSESCDFLRFATRSALSGAQSASLDETLNDLDDLETRIIKSLVPSAEAETVITRKQSASDLSAQPWTRNRLAGAVTGAAGTADSQPLPAAFTAYAAQLASRAENASPDERDRLQKHLYKLVNQLKTLTVTTSKRVATWQPVNHPDVATITEQILQELDSPEINKEAKGKPCNKLINAKEAKQLLLPNEGLNIAGDKQQLEKKLEQMGSKLMMMSSNIVQSVGKPESLGRSVVSTLDCAKNLAALARSLKNNQNPIQNKKIEESALEMSYATYNLLQTSEYVSGDPNNVECRRKLLEALRQLNDSVNKLVRTVCPSKSLQQDCGELARSLQVEQNVVSGPLRPHCALPYSACVDALSSQQDVLEKLKCDKKMPREQFVKDLHYVTASVTNCAEYTAQCAYLISVSEQNKQVAKEGLVDRQKLQRAIGSIQDTCVAIMRSGHVEDAREEKPKLEEQLKTLTQALEEANARVGDESIKQQLEQNRRDVSTAATNLSGSLLDDHSTKDKLTSLVMKLIGTLDRTGSLVDDPSLVPQVANMTAETKTRCDEIMDHSRALITTTQALIKEVNSSSDDSDEMMTWVMFSSKNQVLEVFDALLKSVKTNGERAGILEGGAADDALDLGDSNKSQVQNQVETANKWLKSTICKPERQLAGQEATKKVISLAKNTSEDMKGNEKEEVQQLIVDTEQLLADCIVKQDPAKYSTLQDRLRELKKVIERGMVTRVVENLIQEEAPLEDLEFVIDSEKDATKRNYLLEKKIAELLAQLGRVTRTARFVADAGSGSPSHNRDLIKCSEKAELLAPQLVKAAEERINKPNDQTIIDNYKFLLGKYVDSLSKVRELCDVAVDPMDFVQTAGETMERIREDSSQQDDPHKCARTSQAITKLANRVINVGLSSANARNDPELQQALSAAQTRLREMQPPPGARASRLPHWKDVTDELLRATGEVESVMGGENIFKKRPNSDQPIFSVAMDLHASVREWSSRDNEIVAVAKRVAVLMAKLSDYMNTDKQRELIATSKSIVEESHEVAYLARKLAIECTDLRIKTNLLKTCERIPTIGAQLKMLTTVKGSSLGHQGMQEDKEAMDMLVGNAQSLMLSIQEVVKAAAGASVKIMSQRGSRMKWVRKNYYY